MVSSQGSKKFLLERPKNCLFQECKKRPPKEPKRFLLKSLKEFYVKGLKGTFSRV